MDIVFETIESGVYTIQEDIINETGIDWTDFHWSVSEEVGGVTIIAVEQTLTSFSNLSALPDTVASVDGGLVSGAGGLLAVELTLNVTDGFGQWAITQFPTVATTPEPSTLALLGLGLLGVGYARRRRLQ